MKKILIASFGLTLIVGGANAAGNKWWEKPTICRLSADDCYPNMKSDDKIAVNMNDWDAVANCTGKKKICAKAIKNYDDTEPKALSKSEILNPSIVYQDFEFEKEAINKRNAPCFGIRKTRNSRSEARISDKNGNNSQWVKVYCHGVYDDDPEEILNSAGTTKIGEIMTDERDQATCHSLREKGLISILRDNSDHNTKCYGEFIGAHGKDVYIDCKNGELLPEKIVYLNDATDYNDRNPSESSYPTTEEEVKKKFEEMLTNARKQREHHAVAIVADSDGTEE